MHGEAARAEAAGLGIVVEELEQILDPARPVTGGAQRANRATAGPQHGCRSRRTQQASMISDGHRDIDHPDPQRALNLDGLPGFVRNLPARFAIASRPDDPGGRRDGGIDGAGLRRALAGARHLEGMQSQAWDAARYQSRHSYVFAHGEGLLELLEPAQVSAFSISAAARGNWPRRSRRAARSRTARPVGGNDRRSPPNFPALRFEVAGRRQFYLEGAGRRGLLERRAALGEGCGGVAASIARALRPGGRFVVEMGGKGNVQTIIERGARVGPSGDALVFPERRRICRHCWSATVSRFRFAALFDRPTRVEGEDGLEDWLVMFAGSMISPESPARSQIVCVRRCSAMARGRSIIAGCE